MTRVLLVPLLALAVSCTTNKRTGRSQYLLFPEERMVKLGAEAYLEMTDPKNAKISTDPVLLAPLLRVGRAISMAADKPDYAWEFKLIDDRKTANAWALPGGKIAFYTGIYPILQDEAGLAIVMGHEVMHAILRHSNERMSQSMTAQILLTGAAIGFRDHKNKGAILGALGAGATVGVILPFSRKHESEADEHGLYLAARAGYDPRAAIGVWQRMAEMSKGKRPPQILSTHPDPLKRVEAMRKWMPKAMEHYARSEKKRNRPLPSIAQ